MNESDGPYRETKATDRRARTAFKTAALVLAAALGGMAAVAQADTAVCAGKIIAMSSHAPGGLYVQVEGANLFKVCDFEATQFNLSPANCRHIASLAMMAFALEKAVQVYVDNAPTTACSSVPYWHTANARYFHVYP